MSGRRVALAAGAARSGGWARRADRVLRAIGDPRLALGLLLVAGAANAAAPAVPDGPRSLDAPPYAALLALIVLSGVAAFAVRAPAAWREWRRPGPLPEGADTLIALVERSDPPDAAARRRLADALRAAGYRLAEPRRGAPWALNGTRRGWSRFAGQLSHLALVLVLVGVAIGAAFGRETVFSLLPGDQAFLDELRPGFTDAVRLESFDVALEPDGRPTRLDAEVTFLRDGEPVERTVVQVNAPGSFGGYLVHPWTYGPAAELRITTLGGRPLHDGPVALSDEQAGRPFGLLELPALDATLGVSLLSAERNEVALTAVGRDGVVQRARLVPGDEVRIGEATVTLGGFGAWVTFASRSDPGIGLLFAGASLLVLSLAVAFWLPRRRLSLRWTKGALRLVLRGDRFDRPAAELETLRKLIEEAA
jgi:cytochrome c biogenesis protein ResB